jgi:membrane protease subunit (stomatin/prohibitin family)
LIRLRGHGAFTIRIDEPILFLNAIVGRQARYTTDDIQGYLRDVIIARMNDMLGEKLESIIDLPRRYDELATEFKARVANEFDKYGLDLIDFYIASITPPEDVAKLIDQRSGMEAVGDLDKFFKFEMARGLAGAGVAGQTGSTLGMAAGVGVMMPSMLSRVFAPDQLELRTHALPTVTCPKCHTDTPEQSRFCYRCGNPMVTQNQCPSCHTDLPSEAKFCHQCGNQLDARIRCPHCQADLIAESRYCGSCGKAVSDEPNTSQ